MNNSSLRLTDTKSRRNKACDFGNDGKNDDTTAWDEVKKRAFAFSIHLSVVTTA